MYDSERLDYCKQTVTEGLGCLLSEDDIAWLVSRVEDLQSQLDKTTLIYEWSVRPPNYDPDIWPTWIVDEIEARMKLKNTPSDWVLTRRPRWTTLGEWEVVTD